MIYCAHPISGWVFFDIPSALQYNALILCIQEAPYV